MKVRCVSCGYEINLDHKIFDDYSGPIKCYSCRAMMEVKTAQGMLSSIANQSNSESRLAGLLVAGPKAKSGISSGISCWERASEKELRSKA